MKKWLVLIVIFLLTITSTALAASPSFSDVPAKHWAYESVAKLAKAGIIEGYGDGTFRGDKTMSRYEFAFIIGKALDRYEAADAANRALLDKLSAEFATELNTLGARVKKVENKIGTFKLNGDFRFRYEYVENPAALAWPTSAFSNRAKVAIRDRFRLKIGNEVAPNLSMFSLIVFSGTSTGSTNLPASYTDGGYPYNPTTNGAIEASFLTYKAPDGTMYKFGRNFLFLGQGMLWDVPHSDGLQVTFGNKLRTMVGTQSFIGKTWYFADMKYNAAKDLQLTAAYIQDKHKHWTNSTAVGFVYNATPDWKLSYEYGVNDNAQVNVDNGRSGKLKASIITAKYGQAKGSDVGSTGLWVSYKKAQKGFDLPFASTWTFPYAYPGGLADDLKGFEYGFERTMFKNGIFTVRYNPLTTYDGSSDRKFLIADLQIYF